MGGHSTWAADSQHSSYRVLIHGDSERVSISGGSEPCRFHDTFSPDQARGLAEALIHAARLADANKARSTSDTPERESAPLNEPPDPPNGVEDKA